MTSDVRLHALYQDWAAVHRQLIERPDAWLVEEARRRHAGVVRASLDAGAAEQSIAEYAERTAALLSGSAAA